MPVSDRALDRVGPIIIETVETLVLPRFLNLREGDTLAKGPNDIVTIADLEAEAALERALTGLIPGSRVVGEERSEKDPGFLATLGAADPVWVIDPVDGTRNFAAGNERFCTMVGLRVGGETIAGWIYAPMRKAMASARLGGGACLDGRRLDERQSVRLSDMQAAFSLRYAPSAFRGAVDGRLQRIGRNTDDWPCAGLAYVDQARGELDCAFFWNTKPWDHVAGVCLIEEVGGTARFLDGARYDPAAEMKHGLLTVSCAADWAQLDEALFADIAF